MKKVLLLLVSLVSSFLLATFIGKFYFYLFPLEKGGGIFSLPTDATNLLRGLTLAYFLLLILFFTAFGSAKKYWWIAIALLPAIAFEVAFDLRHIYFPIAIGLVGWLIGRGVEWVMEKVRK